MRSLCKIYRFILLGFGTLSVASRGEVRPATKEVEGWKDDLFLQADVPNQDKQNLKDDKNKIAGDLRRAFERTIENG